MSPCCCLRSVYSVGRSLDNLICRFSWHGQGPEPFPMCKLAFVGRLASHNLSFGFAVCDDRLPGPILPSVSVSLLSFQSIRGLPSEVHYSLT